MKKILIFLVLFIFYSCNKADSDLQQTSNEVIVDNSKTYYIVMVFDVEDQLKAELNERFNRNYNSVTSYFSDVEKVTLSNPISEDFKYQRLDSFEKYMLKPNFSNYIVIDRQFRIFQSYSEASKFRQGEIK